MAITNYYSVNGRILGQKTAGKEQIDYMPESLGSVKATVNQTTGVQNSYSYRPYGAVGARGTQSQPDPKFLHVGELKGIARQEDLTQINTLELDIGIQNTGIWTAVDPLWPAEQAYVYATANPATVVDPSGSKPWYYNCVYKFLYTGDPNASDEVFEAALEGGYKGAACYAQCMADRNKALGIAAAGAIGFAGGGIPKKLLGLPVYPGSSPYTSFASYLNYLVQRLGTGINFRPALRKIKFIIRFCTKKPLKCAKYAGYAYLGINVIFAADCAYECSNEE